MTESEQEATPLPYVAMTNQQILQVIVIGVAVGSLVWGLSFVLETYVLKAVLCGEGATAHCASSSQYATATASILAAGIGLFVLVKQQIFRPLLIALAAVVALWGLPELIALMPPYGVALACALLYALAYLAFTWISRIRFFLPTAVLVIALVVAIRFLLSA